MSILKNEKLKHLAVIWPLHTVASTQWLGHQGYSVQLIHKYIKSNWLKSISRGSVIRAFDDFKWSGAVWGVQQTGHFHIGGKTALELQGKAHFIKRKETDIFIYSSFQDKLPHWFKTLKLNVNMAHVTTHLITEDVGLTDHSFGEFSLKISNPARAILEYIFVMEKHHSFEEAYLLMEGLANLDPRLMQDVLEVCNSIKVKRLTLCLAKKVGVSWLKDLNITKINIGSGARHVVSNGGYDAEFMITYPKSWDEIDNVEF